MRILPCQHYHGGFARNLSSARQIHPVTGTKRKGNF
jgi:hypothetical protein